jgi:RNA polymerase sigma-70 factor (ECF subfamily)
MVMTDEEFAKSMYSMANGDRDALRDIYQEYRHLIYHVILDVIKQPEEAEDLASDFFVKLYGLSNNYAAKPGHKSWIVKIAKNMAVDRVRKIDRECLVEEMPEAKEEAFEEQVVQNIALQEAFSKLKERQRLILDLKILGGFTFREIAEIIESPIGTVTWEYNQTIKKLRKCKL